MTARKLFPVSMLVLALGAFGCDDSKKPAADGGDHDDHDHNTCGLVKNCMGTVDLAKGLSVQSDNKKFTVEVVSASQLMVDGTDFVVKVSDASGTAVKDATIMEDVFSADCMHGGEDPAQKVSANADGNYEIKPNYLHMGPWDSILDITAGSVKDSATLHFCVPDPGEDAGL